MTIHKFFSYINTLAIALVLTMPQALAQTATLLPQGRTQFLDNNGNPLANGKVGNYIPGTLTLKTTWQDAAETIPNANPLTLDSAGRAVIYGSGSYRQIVKTSTGSPVWDAVTASTGGGGGGGGGSGDGNPVGTILPFSGFVVPANYQFATGQELSRTTYSVLYNALTYTQTVSCVVGSPTAGGLATVEQLSPGNSIEASCFPPNTSILSVGTSTVTMTNNATGSGSVSLRVLPYGRGNSSTTFNLPDLRGRTFVGRDNMNGITAGVLTLPFYLNNPDALGQNGGSKSHALLTAELALHSHTSPALTDPGHVHALSQSVTTNNGGGNTTAGGGATVNYNTNVTATSSPTGITLAASTGITGSNQPFSIVQPSLTTNYIIKVLPDNYTPSLTSVDSVGGMIGVIGCSTPIVCAGQQITFGSGSASDGTVLAGVSGGAPVFTASPTLAGYLNTPQIYGGSTPSSGLTITDTLSGTAATNFIQLNSAGGLLYTPVTNAGAPGFNPWQFKPSTMRVSANGAWFMTIGTPVTTDTLYNCNTPITQPGEPLTTATNFSLCGTYTNTTGSTQYTNQLTSTVYAEGPSLDVVGLLGTVIGRQNGTGGAGVAGLGKAEAPTAVGHGAEFDMACHAPGADCSQTRGILFASGGGNGGLATWAFMEAESLASANSPYYGLLFSTTATGGSVSPVQPTGTLIGLLGSGINAAYGLDLSLGNFSTCSVKLPNGTCFTTGSTRIYGGTTSSSGLTLTDSSSGTAASNFFQFNSVGGLNYTPVTNAGSPGTNNPWEFRQATMRISTSGKIFRTIGTPDTTTGPFAGLFNCQYPLTVLGQPWTTDGDSFSCGTYKNTTGITQYSNQLNSVAHVVGPMLDINAGAFTTIAYQDGTGGSGVIGLGACYTQGGVCFGSELATTCFSPGTNCDAAVALQLEAGGGNGGLATLAYVRMFGGAAANSPRAGITLDSTASGFNPLQPGGSFINVTGSAVAMTHGMDLSLAVVSGCTVKSPGGACFGGDSTINNIAVGSQATPSIRLGNDSQTGWYRPAGNQWAFSVLNVTKLNLNSVNMQLGAGYPILFQGSSSGAVTMQTAAAAGTYNFNLPITAGSSGDLLTSGGGGGAAMTWTTLGSAVSANTGTSGHTLPFLDGNNVWSGIQTITTASSNTSVLGLQSTSGDALVGPILNLDRASASPAVNDAIGKVLFSGRDSAAATVEFANIAVSMGSVTPAAASGALVFQTIQSGTLTTRAFMASGLVVGSPTGGDKGLGTINATTVYQNGVAVAMPETVTTQNFITAGASGTYTTPAGVKWIEITMVGPGGSGAGSGTGPGAGAAGGNTCWNTTGAACTTPVYQAGGGSGGSISGTTAAGGTVSGSTAPNVRSISGGTGGAAAQVASAFGGIGGSASCGVGTAQIASSPGGNPGATATGFGNGGGGATTSLTTVVGGGAGAGACLITIINAPAATYTYATGAIGAVGTAGTTGTTGGQGALPGIWVVEHYN